jgi:hypothetical protein
VRAGWASSYEAIPALRAGLGDGGGIRLAQRPPAFASVSSRRASGPTNKTVQVEHGDHGSVARVAVLKQTNAAALLRRPTSVKTSDGAHDVTTVRFYVDDPAPSSRRRARNWTAVRQPRD